MNGAEKSPVLREIGRGHAWGQMLYEVVLNGVVVAKICATPENAVVMAGALAEKQ